MAQASVSIRMDADLKRQFDEFCSEIGMTMTTAFCVFAKTAVREQRIPFEISAERSDPFYSESNIRYLEALKRDIEAGNAHFAKHELIEVD
jgi:addiction module antitoxin, relB/dinJ family